MAKPEGVGSKLLREIRRNSSEASFPFELNKVSEQQVSAIFRLPVNYTNRQPDPFFLTVSSDVGGISVAPFKYRENISGIVGGVSIKIGGEDKLIIVSREYLGQSLTGKDLGMFQSAYLVKANDDDQSILVKPSLDLHKGRPYVLDNDYPGSRHGLLLFQNGLLVTQENAVTLVDRITV